ncbi:aryldialkylphosphatase related protein [Pseudooceanicola batsensis HTCC2597]|uniref:Aryldialkylphosphatase related protein n=1 Tax=Pseudooceanicola batsensis (strain ATCC BAA-863 / DSM 15984 / KCTC 12145 / HTCC2597) TaxID=252305 RepID=A3U1H1_PSEBH|nr:amidohydrolase family protein [Pseudooceanicola batsensis]EAQ02154.1 aryldialkylphosphatase related protein [Pseudooceanicola batsensis HTCC2597]
MSTSHVIKGATLIDGTGADPVRNATVVVQDGLVTYAGPADQAEEPENARIVEADGATVMPGLMDVHVHISLSAPAHLVQEVTARSFGEAAFEVSANLADTVAGGVTTIRTVSDLGHLDIAARDAIVKGKLNGPRVHPCGHGLTTTGGHGDIMPCWLSQSHGDIAEIVDGPDEIRKGIRKQAKAGATWIKLFQTGGVVDPHGRLDAEEFLPCEFEAALEAANLLGMPVCVHAHNKPAIIRSIRNGCRSIEHGMHFDEECAELAKEHGTWLVPTLTVMDRIIQDGKQAGVPDYIIENVIERTDKHREYVKYAYDIGVNIAAGTDAGSLLTPHGSGGQEVIQFVKCGMTVVQAIEVATRNTAKLLQDDTIGTLEPGKQADLIVVDGDVAGDPDLLADRTRMREVLVAGRRVASGGRQVTC